MSRPRRLAMLALAYLLAPVRMALDLVVAGLDLVQYAADGSANLVAAAAIRLADMAERSALAIYDAQITLRIRAGQIRAASLGEAAVAELERLANSGVRVYRGIPEVRPVDPLTLADLDAPGGPLWRGPSAASLR